MFLYGKNSVVERLKNNPQSIKKLFLQEDFYAEELFSLITLSKVTVKKVNEHELRKIVRKQDNLQGIAAEVDEFSYAAFEGMLGKALKDNLSFLCLDNLSDPQNFGAIIRIAACFGGFAIVIPRHDACPVTEAVLHVASGGENYVNIAAVNLAQALAVMKKEGFWICGAAVRGGEDISKLSFPFPLCVVLGSEGKGIRYGVDKLLEMRVSLPMKGAPLSFNVAQASAVFCYEIARQRRI